MRRRRNSWHELILWQHTVNRSNSALVQEIEAGVTLEEVDVDGS
jgi:hypothetical protein